MNEKKLNQPFYAVEVDNVLLSQGEFNNLCDKLSEMRPYAHDYRSISDYQGIGYWQSCAYTYIEYARVTLSSVTTEIWGYLGTQWHGKVKIRIIELERE